MNIYEDIDRVLSLNKKNKIAELFEKDIKRVDQFSFDLGELFIDFSKTHINQAIVEAYAALANDLQFDTKRMELFSGYPINCTENRSVLHTLLRTGKDDSHYKDIAIYNKEDKELAKTTQALFLNQVDSIREKFIKGKNPIKSIVHIGIGGSSLGPQLLYEALAGLEQKIKLHFVDNIDAHQMLAALNQCEPESTLIFGVSKTFNTEETLVNIETARDWFSRTGGIDLRERFFAVTAYPQNAEASGVDKDKIVTFPNWVGGRYSVWSAVSLSVALLLGRDNFTDFLKGAAEVDREFLQSPCRDNPAFIAAMMDHVYGNYFNAASRAIFAYDFRLRSLVPYLQQLEMESNGKDRDILGEPVQRKTSSVVWGGIGTSMQHSAFQLLHQGTQFIPTEFILVKKADHDLDHHHRKLLANGLAQSAALLTGRSLEEVSALPDNADLSEAVKKSKIFSGERPSTTIILESLSPYVLGQLLAFYEHRTFCGGVLSNINSFDQMGVELGKQLAKTIEPFIDKLKDKETSSTAFDSSTKKLLALIS